MGHLQLLDIGVIVIYVISILLVGWWYSRRQENTEEYFVASRGARPIIVGLSMMATLLSTISYIALPGELIKNGPGFMWGMLHFPISFIVVGYFVIPRIMKYKITSGYELLEYRFGSKIRKTGSILFILARLSWMSFIVFTCSLAVTTITQIPLLYILIFVGILTTIYTVMGGIRAVLVTDTIQFGILSFGAVFVVAYVTYRCGGFGWWPDFATLPEVGLEWPKVKLGSLNVFDRVTAINVIFQGSLWWIATATSDQVAIQRYLCTRDAKQARKSYLHCLIADFGTSIILWGAGFALLGFVLKFPQEFSGLGKISENTDKIFPYFIGSVLPAGLTNFSSLVVHISADPNGHIKLPKMVRFAGFFQLA